MGVAGIGKDAGDLKPNDENAGMFGFSRTARPRDIAKGAGNTLAILGVTQRLGPWGAGGEATVRGLTRAPLHQRARWVRQRPTRRHARRYGRRVGPLPREEHEPSRLGAIGEDQRHRERQRNGTGTLADSNSGRFSDNRREPVPVPLGPPALAGTEELPVVIANPKVPLAGTSGKPQRPDHAAKKPPEPGAEEQDEPEPIDAAARLGQRIPEIDVPDMPLLHAVRFLSEMTGLRVTFDLRAMAAVGARLGDR